jgi:hypothetical protein
MSGHIALVVAPYVSIEYWKWSDYAREPVIEVLQQARHA